jgi:hypothetical protein
MLNLIVVIALIAIAAYGIYSAKTPEGWSLKRGIFAIAALAAAAWAYVTGLFQSAPSP